MVNLHKNPNLADSFKQARWCFMAGPEGDIVAGTKKEVIVEKKEKEKEAKPHELEYKDYNSMNDTYKKKGTEVRVQREYGLQQLAYAVQEKGQTVDAKDFWKDDVMYALQNSITVTPLGQVGINFLGMSDITSVKSSADIIANSVKDLAASKYFKNQRELQDAIVWNINNAPAVALKRLAGKQLTLDFNGTSIDFKFLKPGDSPMQEYGVEDVTIRKSGIKKTS